MLLQVTIIEILSVVQQQFHTDNDYLFVNTALKSALFSTLILVKYFFENYESLYQ